MYTSMIFVGPELLLEVLLLIISLCTSCILNVEHGDLLTRRWATCNARRNNSKDSGVHQAPIIFGCA